ncbi:CLUMA_CG017984, isoform A [Clunio marinus]|uniref:CLUMA_CG017984, isoform A n=1 Tax=Clunio marinus TaxID=568069 RepID=A0A1J1J0S8_9DIPT|nr:CLUMA_CG017984, isoform A [Clunio marinus]
MALNGKRMQTFLNEFTMTTTNYLNQFINDCESRFYEFDNKLNKIERNLEIIEQKLASVPSENKEQVSEILPVESQKEPEKELELTNEPIPNDQNIANSSSGVEHQEQTNESQITEQTSNDNLIKICDSFLYKKYFKMIKFGVAVPAVKQKMFSEGLDDNLLDNPDLLIEKTPEDNEE